MKRRNGFIAALLAVFVLHAPLCALACFSGAGEAPGVETASHPGAPCHESAPSAETENSDRRQSPAVPADSHEDCGCEDTYAAVPASSDKVGAQLTSLDVIRTTVARDSLHVRFVWVPRANPKETDLPPPDVLLLKSTLLI